MSFSLCYVEIFTTQATQEVKNVEAKKEVKSDQTVDSSDESSGDSDESGDEESDDEQVFFSFETLFLLDILTFIVCWVTCKDKILFVFAKFTYIKRYFELVSLISVLFMKVF